MLGRYGPLARVPGAMAFSAAAFVARMPISMMGLGTVFLVVAATGSYGLAGAVSATVALTQAAGAPALGRLVDRVGQPRVLLPSVVLHAAGLAALVGLALADAPTWTLFPAAAVYGAAYPSIGSLVRARWAHVVGGTALLPVAYSVESVLDELIFVIGPVLVTALATGVAPAAGLLAALGFAAAGGIALAAQRRTAPPPRPPGGVAHPSALRTPGLRVVAVVAVPLGGVFGAADICVVAFTAERGSPGAAGLVLALLAFGSLLSGLLYGAVRWRAPLHRRFLAATVAVAGATAALPLANSVPVIAVVGVAAGFTFSPTLIAVFGLVEELVPAAALTEGLSWLTTGLGVGIALASTLAGRIIDESGARTALLVAMASGLLTVALALGGLRWLRQVSDPGARIGG